MEEHRQKYTNWFFLVLLGVLFVLSVSFPRHWEQIARQKPLENLLAGVKHVPESNPSRLDETDNQLQPESPIADVVKESPATKIALRPSSPTSTPSWNPGTLEPQPSQEKKELFSIPENVLSRLEKLSCECDPVGPWALKTWNLLCQLDFSSSLEDEKLVLNQLRELTAGMEILGESISSPEIRHELGLTNYYLVRHLKVWELVRQIDADDRSSFTAVASPDPQKLAASLEAVASLTSTPEGQQWREYMLWDSLRNLTQSETDAQKAREIARRVLHRLERTRFTEKQRAYISQTALVDPRGELRYWASESMDARELLQELEQYEQDGLPSSAKKVAEACRRLAWSHDSRREELGRYVDKNYRNANFLVTSHVSFLNRLLPAQDPKHLPVCECIVGYPTRGKSTTNAELQLKLIPDQRALRCLLQASGTVTSKTYSTAGPVTMHSHGNSPFSVNKQFEFNLSGIQAGPTQINVQPDDQADSVETSLDGIPLLGSLVENIAWAKRDSMEDQILCEVKETMTRQIRQEIDGQISPSLTVADKILKERVFVPLDRLQVKPRIRGMRTTQDWLDMELCLAGENQLGGHTPRPDIPSGSVVSVELHQSLLNNVVEQLDLNGNTFTLAELHQRLDSKLNLPPEINPKDMPGNIRVKFAPQDAILLRCQDGLVELTLAFDALEMGSASWEDFAIQVHYRPETDKLGAKFVREGTIHLMGNRIGSRGQIQIRGLFGKMFSAEREWKLLQKQLIEDPRFQGLTVTQFKAHDGWISLAIGEGGNHSNDSVATKPATEKKPR